MLFVFFFLFPCSPRHDQTDGDRSPEIDDPLPDEPQIVCPEVQRGGPYWLKRCRRGVAPDYVMSCPTHAFEDQVQGAVVIQVGRAQEVPWIGIQAHGHPRAEWLKGCRAQIDEVDGLP